MFKYAKLTINKCSSCFSYDVMISDNSLSIFELFLSQADVNWMHNFLQEKTLDQLGGDNYVVFSTDENYIFIMSGLPPYSEKAFKVPRGNFIKMIFDWNDLYTKKAPEIYFTLDENGFISVKTSLEE